MSGGTLKVCPVVYVKYTSGHIFKVCPAGRKVCPVTLVFHACLPPDILLPALLLTVGIKVCPEVLFEVCPEVLF